MTTLESRFQLDGPIQSSRPNHLILANGNNSKIFKSPYGENQITVLWSTKLLSVHTCPSCSRCSPKIETWNLMNAVHVLHFLLFKVIEYTSTMKMCVQEAIFQIQNFWKFLHPVPDLNSDPFGHSHETHWHLRPLGGGHPLILSKKFWHKVDP